VFRENYMIRKILIFLFALTLLIVPAYAEIPTIDHIQPPEMLYISIGGLFFLLALIVWDAHTRFIEGKRFLKLEYFLKVTMGGISMMLAFLISSWLSGRGIIWPVYQGLTYDIQSQSMSILFLAWGLLMTVYTFGVILLYFEESNQLAQSGFNHDRIDTIRH
jgi:hypothetical protein